MELKQFALDREKENEGVWHTLHRYDLEVKIARWNNSRFVNLFTSMTRPYERQMERGTMDFDKQQEIMATVMSQTILLDWRNMKREGIEVPYESAIAREVMLSVPDLREEIRTLAMDEDAYRQVQMEESSKNSDAPSDSSSLGANGGDS